MARRGKGDGSRGPGLEVVRRPGRAPRTRPDGELELARRIGRVRRGLYGLHSDLVYFATGPAEHRARLRSALVWPDVGHITSLARALAEEERLSDWVRFNGYARSA